MADEKITIIDLTTEEQTNKIVVENISECTTGVNLTVRLNNLEKDTSYVIETSALSTDGFVEINSEITNVNMFIMVHFFSYLFTFLTTKIIK